MSSFCKGWRCGEEYEAYINQPIAASISSPDALVRLFAIFDRRVGRRTLASQRAQLVGSAPWPRGVL